MDHWLLSLPIVVGSSRRRESTSGYVMFVFSRVKTSQAPVLDKSRRQDSVTRIYATVVDKTR